MRERSAGAEALPRAHRATGRCPMEVVRTLDAPRVRRVALIALPALGLAVAWMALILQSSIVQGRLAIPPMFDDVAYLLDSARRVNVLYEHGTLAAVEGYFEKPPKSPYATLAA